MPGNPVKTVSPIEYLPYDDATQIDRQIPRYPRSFTRTPSQPLIRRPLTLSERTGPSGLVTVLVARDRGGSTAGACFYLVDTWFLGLKDAAGPRSMDRRRLGGFIQQIFSAWDEPAVQVPLAA